MSNSSLSPSASRDVVLVSMPFVSILLPSIGLGLLHAAMQQRAISSRVMYFNLDFAALDPALYERVIVETSQRDLVGEWIFSGALFRRAGDRDHAYRELLLAPDFDRGIHTSGMPRKFVESIEELRQEVEPFLDRCVQSILELQPRVVGFTSLFQQHVASLALAKRLKSANPDLFLVFGGANCEGVMGRELMRQFSFVDAAVSGEADELFPHLVERVLDQQPVVDLPGVFTNPREAASTAPFSSIAPKRVELDALPDPDYDDFFSTHQRLALPRSEALRIPFETSRGCWWGEKNHCTFCGLNGNTMAHRSKSAERALAELTRLIERYPGCKIEVVDNILDMAYFRDFIPALARAQLPTELFYEVKANLKKPQIKQLARAGITTIQPGIESLSDSVLKIMKKGVSGLQNIQLLKWCAEAGVQASWNVLTGFPGEPEQDYARMAELAPLLFHLNPPAGCSGIRIDRFSPNFDRAEELGFAAVRPFPAYQHVFPLESQAVFNLAYYFTFDYADNRQPHTYVAPLRQQVARWRREHDASQLTAVDNEGRLLILDTRAVAPEPVVVLKGKRRALYAACDSVCTVASLARSLTLRATQQVAGSGVGAQSLKADDISLLLDEFVERKLMVKDRGRYLALAVTVGAEEQLGDHDEAHLAAVTVA